MKRQQLIKGLCGLSLSTALCFAALATEQIPYSSSSRGTGGSRNLTRGNLRGNVPQPSSAGARPRVDTNAPRPASGTQNMVFPLSDQLHGIARPSQQADLPSLVAGTIQTIHVNEGQMVRKGDPLLTLDDRVPRARLEAATVEAELTGRLQRAQVDVKMAQRRLNRLRSALNQGAGAAFELEEAEGVLEQAQATVAEQQDILKSAEATRKLAEAQLSEYTISAPFDGVITEIHRKSGAVDPTIVLVSIANLSAFEVEMHLPSRFYGSIRPGQTLPLVASSPVGGSLSSKVISASPVINSASNTFRCLLRIENPQSRLPAGFSVLVNTQQNGRPVASAVQSP